MIATEKVLELVLSLLIGPNKLRELSYAMPQADKRKINIWRVSFCNLTRETQYIAHNPHCDHKWPMMRINSELIPPFMISVAKVGARMEPAWIYLVVTN